MAMSLNCLLLGNTSFDDTFAVNVADKNQISDVYVEIKNLKISDLKYLVYKEIDYNYNNKFNHKDIDLWKVDIAYNDGNKLKHVATKDDIKKELGGQKLVPTHSVKKLFSKQSRVDENIHVIVQLPAAAAPISATGPNWNDASSIYEWMQKFTLNRGRTRLVKTFGKDFEFCGRNDAIDTLWNGTVLTDGRNGIVGRFGVRNYSDKNLHPIPVVAGGPGTGKSRFLDEVEQLLSQYANESGDDKIRDAFTNMTVINTTYGNGCPADDIDINISAQASLSIRILFEYFRPQPTDMGNFDLSSFRSICNDSNILNFTISTALQVIYIDIMQMKQMAPNSLLALVLGIDEFNKLHDINKDTSKKLVNSIGGLMCSSPKNIFFIPILAGTIEGPLDMYITESMHKPLHIPLYLLEENYAIEIGKSMDLFDDNYVKCHPYFRVSISDIGGHVRSLEYFYKTFKELKQQWENLYDVKLEDIMKIVKQCIRNDYGLVSHSEWLIEALAKAILGLPVKKEDEIKTSRGPTSYRDLSSMGILNLVLVDQVTGEYQIRLPYSWASVLVQASSHTEMTYWKSMFSYDKPIYWQNFEDFNAKFWALRLSLFRLLGHEKIELKELLRGAKFSRGFPEVVVTLPKEIYLRKLRHRYSVTTTNNDDDMEVSWGIYLDKPNNDDIKKHMDHVFLNASGAPWDVFGFLEYCNNDSSETGILCIAQQDKLTDIKALSPMIIDQALYDHEYEKVTKAMVDVPVDDWALLFLTNADAKNLSVKCKKNSAFISRKQFQDFYGYTYASRAQFASANERIYINSAPPESLQILGFADNECYEISKKRPFDNLDDLKTKISISCNKFKRLKRDDRITFTP